MKNVENNHFYLEKTKNDLKTWPWSYFWRAMDLFLEQKMKKIAKWKRQFLLIFFKNLWWFLQKTAFMHENAMSEVYESKKEKS